MDQMREDEICYDRVKLGYLWYIFVYTSLVITIFKICMYKLEHLTFDFLMTNMVCHFLGYLFKKRIKTRIWGENH